MYANLPLQIDPQIYMQEVNNIDPLISGSSTILHTQNTCGDKLLKLKLDIRYSSSSSR